MPCTHLLLVSACKEAPITWEVESMHGNFCGGSPVHTNIPPTCDLPIQKSGGGRPKRKGKLWGARESGTRRGLVTVVGNSGASGMSRTGEGMRQQMECEGRVERRGTGEGIREAGTRVFVRFVESLALAIAHAHFFDDTRVSWLDACETSIFGVVGAAWFEHNKGMFLIAISLFPMEFDERGFWRGWEVKV